MLRIGCQLSTKKGLLAMAEQAASIGAKGIQFFTRNPRGAKARETNLHDLASFQVYVKKHGITNLLAYGPYTLEPACAKQEQRDFAASVIAEDLAKMEDAPGQCYLIRPGSAVGEDPEDGVTNLISLLNEVLAPSQNTTLLIANMPGSGSQICATFEEIAEVLNGVKLADHVGVCFDASDAWAAGYDIKNDLEGVLAQFDKIVGLDKIRAVHLNDCKEALGAKAVRHTRIGEGEIGFDALAALVNHPALADVPFYLEEPLETLMIYGDDIAKFTEAYRR